jgi:hypothetical protein
VTRRRRSLLSQEVKAEDIGGPAAWESSVVPDSGDFVPVYETVCGGGWDCEWPPETKSLAEEVAEDSAARGTEVKDDQDEQDQDASEEEESGDVELGVYDGDDLLLLAQHTPLPLDLEVDNCYDDQHTECESNQPTTAVDTLMPVQRDIISAAGANTIPETALDTASSALTAENLRALESYSQSAGSPIKGSNPRVTTPYSIRRYWYRQHKSGSPESKPKVECWELVSVASS